ncbi:MAG: hypothetical protein NZ900_08055 [Synergistetes bacterium]|nr:hypothetical protein [Synergistota bacterium]MDW8192871.1 hypothetical protein [Synergistota bacterium]
MTTNRRLRLASLSPERVYELFRKNLEDFRKLLNLSSSMGLAIFRLGSNFIPFASHPNFKGEWLEPIEKDLLAFSSELKRYSIRITMHPGQFVSLSSPRKEVVDASLRELKYHFWVLDKLGLGRDSIVVVHIGGSHGSKLESLRRFVRVISDNEWLIERLAEFDPRDLIITWKGRTPEFHFPLSLIGITALASMVIGSILRISWILQSSSMDIE